MPNRAYTVHEIDALRRCVRDRFLWGTCVPRYEASGRGMSRSYQESEMAATVEHQLRTYMLAGVTAQDLIAADQPPNPPPSDSA